MSDALKPVFSKTLILLIALVFISFFSEVNHDTEIKIVNRSSQVLYNHRGRLNIKKHVFITLLAVLLFPGFSACEQENKRGFFFDEKTFKSNWNKWENGNILNYSFTFNGRHFGSVMSRELFSYEYEVNITVKDGAMESFEYIGKNIPYSYYYDKIAEHKIQTISTFIVLD